MQHPSPTPFRRSVLPFLAAALLLAAAAGADDLQTGPKIEPSNGRQPISSLFIGSHLAAGLSGGQPSAGYTFRLRDADGLVIASVAADANAAGEVPAVPLWAYTGVVGCDLGVVADPALYLFASFTDAEDVLGGTTLQLEALDEDGVAVAFRSLPVLATPHEVPYFSDAAGCRRSHFPNDEDVYVSFYHPQQAVATRALYLVGQPAGGLQIGDPVADVRSGKPPQIFTLPPAGTPAKVKVWVSGATFAGQFALLSRPAGEAVPDTFVQDTDTVVEMFGDTSNTGLNVGVNSCNCIVPPG